MKAWNNAHQAGLEGVSRWGLRHSALSLFLSFGMFFSGEISSRAQEALAVHPVIIPSVNFAANSLEEAIDFLATRSRNICYPEPGQVAANFVLCKSRLTEKQLSTSISLEGEDMTYEEVLYAICKSLGIGYRVEPHAYVISSRSHVGLPRAPSERVKDLPDGAHTRSFLVLAVWKK